MRRASYQRGSLRLRRHTGGEQVWEYRWRETQLDGSRTRRATIIGSFEEYPNESIAQGAVDALRLTINQQTPRQQVQNIGVETLVNHYREHEMPDVFYRNHPKPESDSEEVVRKTYGTQDTYEGYLKKWILPRWRSYRIQEVKAVAVEKWLATLPLERGSRAKIRNIMSALYSHAIRWEWTDRNPITSVRQSAKRLKVPVILTVEEINALLTELPEPIRTCVLLDASTGLRVGELLGLQWQDVDFENLEIHIRRSVVKQKIGAPKTEASAKPIPLDVELAEVLLNLKQSSRYSTPGDWVFASSATKGKQPYWPGTLNRVYLRAASKAAGIQKHIGWHTFRHTFGTLLAANGENPKVVQELLRHSNFKVTADTYLQAVGEQKRSAQTKLVRMILPGKQAVG